MCPFSVSSFIHPIHFCICCCICSGDPVGRSPPRYKNTNSLMIPPCCAAFTLYDVRRAWEWTIFFAASRTHGGDPKLCISEFQVPGSWCWVRFLVPGAVC